MLKILDIILICLIVSTTIAATNNDDLMSKYTSKDLVMIRAFNECAKSIGIDINGGLNVAKMDNCMISKGFVKNENNNSKPYTLK